MVTTSPFRKDTKAVIRKKEGWPLERTKIFADVTCSIKKTSYSHNARSWVQPSTLGKIPTLLWKGRALATTAYNWYILTPHQIRAPNDTFLTIAHETHLSKRDYIILTSGGIWGPTVYKIVRLAIFKMISYMTWLVCLFTFLLPVICLGSPFDDEESWEITFWIRGHKTECYYTDVKLGSRIFVNYEVGTCACTWLYCIVHVQSSEASQPGL